MSDLYLAENADGDLTVWLVMPNGEDRPILDRSDLDIGRPLGLGHRGRSANAEAVTTAHDELWAKITNGLINYDTAVWLRGDDFDYVSERDADWYVRGNARTGSISGSANIWFRLDGFDPADFTDPELPR